METKIQRALEVIVSPDRRAMIEALKEEGAVDLRTLEKSDRIAHIHSHLPKMTDSGIVLYFPDDGMVVRGPNFDTAYQLLDMAESLSEAQTLVMDKWDAEIMEE